MSNVKKYTPVQVQSSQTMSFGAHRYGDHPASAVRAGASTMPSAWQTRGVPSYNGPIPRDAPVRSFGDIMLDPIRWAWSSALHKTATAMFVCTIAVVFIF